MQQLQAKYINNYLALEAVFCKVFAMIWVDDKEAEDKNAITFDCRC